MTMLNSKLSAYLNPKSEILISKQIPIPKFQCSKQNLDSNAGLEFVIPMRVWNL